MFTQPTLPVQVVTQVPDHIDGWEDNFEIPVQFSTSTMAAITKKQLNSTARREIVQATASKIMNVCRYPTMQQVNVVASKIVGYIGVKDTFGVGYVSLPKPTIYMYVYISPHLFHII